MMASLVVPFLLLLGGTLPSLCRAQQQQQQQYCIDQVVGCFDDQGSTRQLSHAIAKSNHRQSQSLCASACHAFCKYSAYPIVSLRTVGGDALTYIGAAANHNTPTHSGSTLPASSASQGDHQCECSFLLRETPTYASKPQQ